MVSLIEISEPLPIIHPLLENWNDEILELLQSLDAQRLSVTGDTAKYLVLHSREVVHFSHKS